MVPAPEGPQSASDLNSLPGHVEAAAAALATAASTAAAADEPEPQPAEGAQTTRRRVRGCPGARSALGCTHVACPHATLPIELLWSSLLRSALKPAILNRLRTAQVTVTARRAVHRSRW